MTTDDKAPHIRRPRFFLTNLASDFYTPPSSWGAPPEEGGFEGLDAEGGYVVDLYLDAVYTGGFNARVRKRKGGVSKNACRHAVGPLGAWVARASVTLKPNSSV